MRYFFIELKELNGEREYNHRMVRKCDDMNETPVGYATNVAKQFYSSKMHTEKDDPDTFYFSSGEVYIQVYRAEEITEAEYTVMAKYS